MDWFFIALDISMGSVEEDTDAAMLACRLKAPTRDCLGLIEMLETGLVQEI